MKIVTRTITAVEGFPKEIGFYLDAWEKSRAELRESVADLSKEELAQKLTPAAPQIGGLILHIGEAEASWIHSIVAERELSVEEKKAVHWCDTTETDFAEKGYTANDCVRLLDKIGATSREILARFSDEDLENLISYDRRGKRVEVSLRWVLCHLIDHEANHKGQIAMLKRLLRERDE
ncbi:MAG TPA: DinB family protein [Pyrinomonadaceae bacterium]|jgi:uncharacterized damage-inducible protein DinB